MKRTVLTVGLLSLAATAYAVVSPSSLAKFNAAVKAYRSNQNAEALKLFAELDKENPQNIQIRNNYAVLLFANGKIEQAEELLSGVIESNREVNVAFKNLNKIYDYAAAKAYSTALGTEKEVKQQKLQIIESLALPTDQKVVTVADNAPISAQVAPVVKAQEPPKAVSPVATPVAVTPAAVATPTPTAVTTPPPAPALAPANALQVISEPMKNWANAWSSGNIDAYMGFYVPNYAPAGMTHSSWVVNRKARISPDKKIQVAFSDIVMIPSQKSDTIIVNFKQSYKANQYQDNTSKQLVWKKMGDKWLIEKEASQ